MELKYWKYIATQTHLVYAYYVYSTIDHAKISYNSIFHS